MLPTNRPPTTPGEVLTEEFLAPLEITQTQLAERLGVHVNSINQLANGKKAVSAEMAWKLAKAFDTTPEFWMNLQTACDLWAAKPAKAAR